MFQTRLTPSLLQPVLYRTESCTDTPANSIFSGPISTLNAMRFGDNPFTCKYKKEEKKAHFYWSFSNDIKAEKGLNSFHLEAEKGLNSFHLAAHFQPQMTQQIWATEAKRIVRKRRKFTRK